MKEIQKGMEQFKKFCEKYLKKCMVMSFIIAMTLDFIIETLARHSIIEGLKYIVLQPGIFLYNSIIIFAMLSLAIFFRRKIFVWSIVCVFWLTIGIANGVILSNRMTPFTVKDLDNLSDGVTIITNYFSTAQIIFIALGILLAVSLFAFLYKKGPKDKERVNFKKSIAAFLAVIMVICGSSAVAIQTGMVSTFFGNLAYAYSDYGVPYCFINTWLNTGVKKPTGYDKKMMTNIFDEGELEKNGFDKITKDDNCETNVIFLQLESFIDPALINSIEVSGDVMPYWNSLQEKYSSGFLTVPSVGAGTANVEFETICGMSVKYFGPGEYPYKSILKEKVCESYAHIFKQMGYSTHAIHNHRGVFYARNEVFPNLGFDTFTSLEYMSSVSKTPKNWAKDAILTEQIMAALKSTDSQDYIYTISVQGHGKYPIEEVILDPKFKVTKAPTEELKWAYEYYVQQLYEMDLFIENLTRELENYDEKVVLVMYGDHLPALEMEPDEMVHGNVYQTEYIIWDNFGMKKKDQDLVTYQMGAEVLDRLGIHKGTMTIYHQNHKDDEDYLTNLRALEYDMLYGKGYMYGDENPIKAVEMRMGINEIKVNELVQVGESLYIKGENFTECSRISLDGKALKTIYLGPNILGLLEDVDPEDVPRMKVSQVDRNSDTDILSTTE